LKKILYLCCFALALQLGSAAWAEKADRGKPMNIEADNLDHDELKQLSIFTGKVVATKGTLVLRGARLEVMQDPEGYQYGLLIAEPGKKAFYRQKREGLDEWMEGEGERIEYDARSEKAELFTRARILRSGDDVRGSHITYDARTEFYNVVGGRDVASPNNPDGRVRAVLQPRTNPTGAPAAEPAEKRPNLNLKASGGIAAPRTEYPEPMKK
jgi:lipopolysaccharide export system protein LptA